MKNLYLLQIGIYYKYSFYKSYKFIDTIENTIYKDSDKSISPILNYHFLRKNSMQIKTLIKVNTLFFIILEIYIFYNSKVLTLALLSFYTKINGSHIHFL